jgi:uncharacterized protein YjbI with pentapeptide repeats
MADTTPASSIQRSGRSVWDWVSLLLLPLALLAGLLFWSWQQNQWQTQARAQQRATALQIAHAQQQQNLLTGYMDAITDLMLHENLLTSDHLSIARQVAQVRTDMLLKSLDGQGKGDLLRFLFNTKLISNDTPIITFRDADLSGAYLHNLDLRDVNISGANLSGANLSGGNFTYVTFTFVNLSNANLQGSDLRGSDLHNVTWKAANLQNANLQDALGVGTEELGSASSLAGATLPDGSIHR